jgi:hypothetical protein
LGVNVRKVFSLNIDLPPRHRNPATSERRDDQYDHDQDSQTSGYQPFSFANTASTADFAGCKPLTAGCFAATFAASPT